MLFASLRISLRRTGQNLRLTGAVVCGIVLAVTIVASTIVYFEALRDVALARSLEKVEPGDLDVLVKGQQLTVNETEHENLTARVEDDLLNGLNRYASDRYFGMQSWTFLVREPPILVGIGECPCRPNGVATGPDDVPAIGEDGQPDPRGEGSLIACDCRRVSMITIPELEDSITLIEGEMPDNPETLSPVDEIPVIEGLLDAEAANAFGLRVGDMIPAEPFWESPREGMDVVLSGIYERTDPDGSRWAIYDAEFTDLTETLSFARFIVREETFVNALGPYFPSMGADYVWLVDTDPGTIHATDTGSVRGTLARGQVSLGQEVDGFRVVTQLDQNLADFEVDLFFNRIPMLIVLALVAAVSLYYAGMVAAALLGTQRSEIALMRSRGATRPQIFGVYVIEAVFVAALAVTLGPLISMAMVSAIGTVPWFEDLNSGQSLPVQLTQNIMVVSLLGAAFGMLALLIPAYRATSLNVLSERRNRGRPSRINVIQRYYLDLGFLALVAGLFWQLSRQGSFVATDVFGETSVNNLTLAIPALLLLIAGVALLRVFPLVADGVARLLATRVGSIFVPSAVFLGIRQLSRNPAGQARLSLLLVLVSSLGVFAATFSSTLERSAREQEMYDVGAEYRVTDVAYRSNIRSVSAERELLEIGNIGNVSGVLRTEGAQEGVIAGTSERFTVLGVDTQTFGDTAWHRDDFYGESMNSLMEEVRPDVAPGLALPDDGRYISILVKPLVRRPDVLVIARMSDRNGRYYSIPVGDLSPLSTARNLFHCPAPNPNTDPDWCRLGTSVFPPPGRGVDVLAPQMPVTLHSIGVVDTSGDLDAGALLFDDVTVYNNIAEDPKIVASFDDFSQFRMLEPSAEALGDTLEFETGEDGQDIVGIGEFRWTDAAPGEYRGFALGPDEPTIPAIVSASMSELQSADVGDVIVSSVEGVRVRFEVTRIVESFPTVNNDLQPFLVADLDLLKQALNLGRIGNDIQANEYWIDTGTEPGAVDDSSEKEVTPADVKSALGGPLGGNSLTISSDPLIDRDAQIAQINLDPLVTTGWQALLSIAFAAVLLVSAAGYAVHSRTSFMQRRSEMALLRTLGLSRLQVVIFIAIEQVLVISIAVGTGAFLGSRLGDTIFPFLARSGRIGTVEPPMVVQFEPSQLGLVFGVMGAVVLTIMAVVVWSSSRTVIHSVMRAGDG